MAVDVKPVQFPGQAQDAGASDLSDPVVRLLQGLSLLGSKDELTGASSLGAVFSGPPQSVAILEAGATAVTKWWSAALGTGITATGVVAAVKGSVFSGKPLDWGHIALIGEAALVIAAMSLAVAIIVGSDIRGRATGAAAQIRARADVATAFLALARPVANGSVPGTGPVHLESTAPDQLRSALLAVAARQYDLKVMVSGHPTYQSVTGVRFDRAEQLQLRVGDDWVSTSRVEEFTTV
jgi:hypothetical protein